MARLFVPLDVEFATDPKILAAGPLAAYLYIVSLAYAKRKPDTDGAIHRSQLPVLTIGLPGKPAKHAQALIDAGLWASTPDGFRITAWTKHNQSGAQLRAAAEIASENGAHGNHIRHHVNEGKPSPKCRWCIDEHLAKPSPPRSPGDSPPESPPVAKEEVEGKVEEEVEVITPPLARVVDIIGTRQSDLGTAIAEHLGQASTSAERGTRSQTIKELKALHATAQDVHERCDEYRRRHPSMPLTDAALLRHWSSLAVIQPTSMKLTTSSQAFVNVAKARGFM